MRIDLNEISDPNFTLEEWKIVIEDLIFEHGPHAVLGFDAGYNNVGAFIELEKHMSQKFEEINKAVIEAAKAKDSERLLVLRTLVSNIRGVALQANRKEINDEDVTTALVKGVKQREDSISQFTSAGRTDLVEKETYQMNVLKEFLPAQMSQDEIKEVVLESVERVAAGGEKTKKLMGKVMQDLNPKLKGKADMKYVNQLLSTILT